MRFNRGHTRRGLRLTWFGFQNHALYHQSLLNTPNTKTFFRQNSIVKLYFPMSIPKGPKQEQTKI